MVYSVGFSLSWGCGESYAFTCAPYSPMYSTFYSYAPYCSTWYYSNRGYSYMYYGGWGHGGYGGFSYVYNPWPVYRTYYFTSAPTVTQTETVYVIQPAATVTYEAAAPSGASATALTQAPVQAAVTETKGPPVAEEDVARAQPVSAGVEEKANPAFGDVFYDYGEPLIDPEAFTLDFASYAETLDAEQIGASYAGLDRLAPDADLDWHEATAIVASP